MTGFEMFYTREWSILRLFYTWDFMQKEISVTIKMFYFMVPFVLSNITEFLAIVSQTALLTLTLYREFLTKGKIKSMF